MTSAKTGAGRRAIVALLVLLTLLPAAPAAAAACSFQLGLRAIQAQIGDLVGQCLEDERFNIANGNAEQRTSAHHGKGGLLVWRKRDNWTAFTDGHWTWINGPLGLQRRLNAERFDWEKDPPGEPALAWRKSDVAVVFLEGYGSNLGTQSFDEVQATLQTRHGWSPDQFLRFSYAGGVARDSGWQPAPYGCRDTAQGLETSVDRLETMLAAYRAIRPSTRFVIAGHSLGGLIGWRHLQRIRDANANPGGLIGVVAVGSPLHGVSPTKAFLLGLACAGPQLDDLIRLYRRGSALAEEWSATAAWARHRGIAVATVANMNDCLYWPDNTACSPPARGWADERTSQIVDGAGVEATVSIDPGWARPIPDSHLAALRYRADAVASLIDVAARTR